MDFLQAVPTRDSENQQVVYRTRPAGGVLSQVAGISDSTVQLYFYDIGNIGIPHEDHIRTSGVSFFPQVAGIVE